MRLVSKNLKQANGLLRRSAFEQFCKPTTRQYSTSGFTPLDTFARRHLGSNAEQTQQMVDTLGFKSLDDLIAATVPQNIRLQKELSLDSTPKGEQEFLESFRNLISQNEVFKSFIGMGYHNTKVPLVILRNMLENPAWYTQYTPYQAEISQGRLESLLNFQTMVQDLTGLPTANASLLDEATAAAEAMAMCFNLTKNSESNDFFISELCHPQTIAVVKTRAEPLGINVIVGDHTTFDFTKTSVAGAIIQYPATNGNVFDYSEFVQNAHNNGALVACAADLLSLTLLKAPGEFGADIAFGSAQRFGVPLGYGGPHAAFFATRDEYKRSMPGRIIGVSKDARGKQALRMALQTREQHIRREKATSNICTAQALLSNMAAMYSLYHGPKGLKEIATRAHTMTCVLANYLTQWGYTLENKLFFDTITVSTPSGVSAQNVKERAEKHRINLRYFPENPNLVGLSLDEGTTAEDLVNLLDIFSLGKVSVQELNIVNEGQSVINNSALARTSEYLTHPIFSKYHTEHELLRYMYKLQTRDLSLTTSMISLGSCTMKLNATVEMTPVSWPEINNIHPFVPLDQVKGYHAMFRQLENSLSEITGFAAVSLQPNAGSQGEYTGLLVIREYLKSIGQGHRNVCLIPVSAHGTNPASAAMAGMKIIIVKCDDQGSIDIADLRAKAEQNKDNLACLMMTYPSTHGTFEEGVTDVCKIIHSFGGQVYMDGANMNAQVGLCRPGDFGADVCHLNLHKTFCIPHGGGGPGMGPIGVAKHLAPFLPSHPVIPSGGSTPIGPVAAAPYSSASILPISHVYINLMGPKGLALATKYAILNANYMAKRLEKYYNVVYRGKNGTCAHEFIIDMRPFKVSAGIEAEDVAKRLMDYGFHAPTMSFPIAGTLMIEPTESESKEELDRLCEALISIRKEIQEVEEGKLDRKNNMLKHAPHTADILTLTDAQWNRPYTRERAVYPVKWVREHKFWPYVARVDNVYGDKNFICSCPPIESYEQQ